MDECKPLAFGSIAMSDVSGVCLEMAGGLHKKLSASYARDFCNGSVAGAYTRSLFSST